MYEFKRLRDEKVPQAELEEAKGSIVSSFALSLENPSRIAESWMAVKYYGLPADYYDNYSDQIAKVDADAVQRVARKYIDLDHLQYSGVAMPSRCATAVAKYGTLEMFDAEGKAVEAKPKQRPAQNKQNGPPPRRSPEQSRLCIFEVSYTLWTARLQL